MERKRQAEAKLRKAAEEKNRLKRAQDTAKAQAKAEEARKVAAAKAKADAEAKAKVEAAERAKAAAEAKAAAARVKAAEEHAARVVEVARLVEEAREAKDARVKARLSNSVAAVEASRAAHQLNKRKLKSDLNKASGFAKKLKTLVANQLPAMIKDADGGLNLFMFVIRVCHACCAVLCVLCLCHMCVVCCVRMDECVVCLTCGLSTVCPRCVPDYSHPLTLSYPPHPNPPPLSKKIKQNKKHP